MVSPKPRSEVPLLKRDDIHTGLSLLQTIYGVAIALGFKNAIEASYSLFLSPLSSPSATLPHWAALFVLGAIMLLGLRFFWVPRNLYAYLLASNLPLKDRLRRLMVIHVPIAMLHALLFYCVCEAYADLVRSSVPSTSALGEALTSRVVLFYASLLLLNAVWLLSIGGRRSSSAESIWGWNNLVCAFLAGVAFGVFKAGELPTVTFIVLAGVIFVINGAIDLWKASEYYILFPD